MSRITSLAINQAPVSRTNLKANCAQFESKKRFLDFFSTFKASKRFQQISNNKKQQKIFCEVFLDYQCQQVTCAEKIRLPFFSYIDVDCLPGKGEGRGGGCFWFRRVDRRSFCVQVHVFKDQKSYNLNTTRRKRISSNREQRDLINNKLLMIWQKEHYFLVGSHLPTPIAVIW